jgi:hypothetical protein
MQTRHATLAAALALALAAQAALAQDAPATAAPAEAETAIIVPEAAPPGASAQVGFGALIGLLAGIVVVAAMVSGS